MLEGCSSLLVLPEEHARIMEPLSLRGLVQNIGPGALRQFSLVHATLYHSLWTLPRPDSVPDSVRAHIIAVIRQFLEQQLVE